MRYKNYSIEDITNGAYTYDSEADASFETNESAPAAGMSPTQIVLLCVGGAVVLALTAGVTLLLIRRKRKAGQTNENPHA